MTLHPEHGARIVLERRSASGSVARYQVCVYAPEGVLYTAGVELSADGVAQESWPEPPPDWVQTFVGRLLKSTAKKHASSETWPRKLTRWRDQRR